MKFVLSMGPSEKTLMGRYQMYSPGAESSAAILFTHSVSNIITHERLAVNLWHSASMMLGLQIRYQLRLLRLFECDSLELEVRFRRIEALDEVCTPSDLGCGQRRERVGWDLFGDAHHRARCHLLRSHDGIFFKDLKIGIFFQV